MQIIVDETPELMGQRTAADFAAEVRTRLHQQPRVRVIFAAAPSQAAFTSAVQREDLDWARIDAFHMDEYVGLPAEAPQRFGRWLCRHLFDQVPLGSVHLMDPDHGSAEAYAAALAEAPIDVVCAGIGVNAHLAFNDPPANLTETRDLIEVELATDCRQQQVDDGCFTDLDQVPTRAWTLTIPRLLNSARILCSVPGARKAQAVYDSLYQPVSGDHPGTALRHHPACTLYLDRESAALLEGVTR